MNRERLPKTLIVSGTWGILALSTLVAMKSLLPSYNLISARENQKLAVAANSQAYAVKQFLQISQVSSQQIVNYVTKNSESSATKHQKRMEPRLFTKNGVLEFGNYLNRSIVGISYFNTNGELVSKAGLRVPQNINISKPSDQVNHQFIKLASEVYLMITAPVGKKQNIGQLVILVNLKDLKYSLTKFNEIYQTDNTILLNDQQVGKNAQVFTFSDQLNTGKSLLNQSDVLNNIDDFMKTKSQGVWDCKECQQIFGYSQIPNTDWNLLVTGDKNQMYSKLTQEMTQSTTTIGSILIGLTAVISLVFRPLRKQVKQEIKQRKQVEAHLNQAKDLQHNLFDYHPAFSFAIDQNGQILSINQTMLKALEYEVEELAGNNYIMKLIPLSEREKIAEIFQRVIEEKKPVEITSTIVGKNGVIFLIDWRFSGIFDKENGKCQLILGAGIDITDKQRVEDEVILLQKMTQAIGEAPDFEAALGVALRLVCEATGWELGEAWLPNSISNQLECSPVWYIKNDVNPISKFALDEFRKISELTTFKPDIGLPGSIFSEQKPIWVNDVSLEKSIDFLRQDLAQNCGIKASFGVPIISGNQVLAVLVFFMFVAKEEDTRQVELISSVAMQLGSLFERKQVEAKYRSIFENSVEGIFQTTPEGKYISANPALARIYGYDSPAELITQLGDIEHQLYVCVHRRAEFISLLQNQDYVAGFESQVYRADGRIIWISENARSVRDSRGNLLYYEGAVVDITERKQIEEQLRYNAYHDPLTGLWNRAWFTDRLIEAFFRSRRELDYQFGLLFLDLDGFKLINDSLGHWVGDQLLIAIAHKLEDCTRPGDTLARLGGDEFIMLLDDIKDINTGIDVAQSIQKSLSHPLAVSGHQLFAKVSIGIVPGRSEHTQPLDLLRDADTALYRAKDQGKGRYVVFDSTMREKAVNQLQLQTDLQWAIERGEFEVYYQPIIRLSNCEISGFEALVRWNHPEKGLVSPTDFIPAAEEMGSINEIGAWVMQTSCHQLRNWKKQFPQHSRLRMNVNLSGKQLTPDLSDLVNRILLETGLEGWDLKLEITETTLMAEPETAIAVLKKLKDRDIQICIDDFGTGYCSLSYLHRFPIDTLKIDRSFVNQLTNQNEKAEIVKTIIALAHSLGMDAVAEGIESMYQLHELLLLKCKYGQGYFFSKPLNYQAATTLLDQYKSGVNGCDIITQYATPWSMRLRDEKF